MNRPKHLCLMWNGSSVVRPSVSLSEFVMERSEQLLTAAAVCELLACSPRWLRYASKRVPGRVMLGPRAPRWRRSILQEWIVAGCPDPFRHRAADSGNSEERSGDESDSVQNAGNGAEEIEFTSGVMKHGRRKKSRGSIRRASGTGSKGNGSSEEGNAGGASGLCSPED